jgi:hypothetical protein
LSSKSVSGVRQIPPLLAILQRVRDALDPAPTKAPQLCNALDVHIE